MNMEYNNSVEIVLKKKQNGEEIVLEVHPGDTVGSLKKRALQQLGEPLNFDEFKIDGKSYEEDTNILEYFTSGGLNVTHSETTTDETEETETMCLITEDQDIKLNITSAGDLFCAAPNCTSNKFDTPDIPLFKFPLQKRRCRQWLVAAGKLDLLREPIEDLHEQLSLCSNHFPKESFMTRDRKTLKHNAVPLYFTHNPGHKEAINELVRKRNETAFFDNKNRKEVVISDVQTILLKKLQEPVDVVEDDESEQRLEMADEDDEDDEYEADDDDEAEPEHPGLLCRLCAGPLCQQDDLTAAGAAATSGVFIFSEEGDKEDIYEKINSCLPISVKKTDPLPKQICTSCSLKLETTHLFVETCIMAEMKLKTLTKKYLLYKLKKPGKVKRVVESEGNKKKTSVYCCPLCPAGSMSVHGNMAETREQNTICIKKELANVDEDDVPSGLFDVMKFTPDDDTGHDILATSLSDVEDLFSDEEEEEDEGEEKQTMFANTTEGLYLHEEKFELTYDCDICEEMFTTHGDSLEHCKLHGYDANYPCIVCGVLLSSEEELTTHFNTHKNKTWQTARRMPGKPLLECGSCLRKFNTKKDFILHQCSTPILNVLTPSEEGELYCEMCDRTFKTFDRAARHRGYHTGNVASKLPCPSCIAEFETEEILKYHTETAHGLAEPPTCQYCSLKFYSQHLLTKHEKIHSQTTYQCNFCTKTSVDYSVMESHVANHMSLYGSSNSLQCQKCNLKFSKRSQYLYHMENSHETEMMCKRMPSLIQYQCPMCSVRCTTSQDTLIHRTTHFKSNDESLPFVCEYCGDCYPSTNSLARHRRIMHPSVSPYVCTVCGVKTRTLYEARVHRKTHTGYVPPPTKRQCKIYQCDQCPSLFSDKASFMTHKKTHRQTRGYQCDFCKKTFPERHRLIVHQRQHTGEKPYSCGVCGKKFAQTSAMYTHSLLHTGETPHGCDLCGRRFRIKSDRDNHRRTHTGEKPFHCLFCGKSFRTGQVYYQHRMIHTGERRFPCDVCGRAFKRSHTLVCHKRIHTGEKPNICDVCGKGFRQRTDMRKHKMNLHGVTS